MKYLPYLSLLGLLLGPLACGGSPKGSKDKAVATAIAAVQANDSQAYMAVMVTSSDIRELCPREAASAEEMAEYDAARAKLPAKIAKKIKPCADINWTDAKEVSRTGGEFRRMMDKCGGKLGKYKDIKILFALSNGERAEVKLDDPVGVEGGFFAFTDEPRCRVTSNPEP